MSWGHQLTLLGGGSPPMCDSGSCLDPAVWLHTYHAADRKGRTTKRRRPLCTPHARSAARRHGIDGPFERQLSLL